VKSVRLARRLRLRRLKQLVLKQYQRPKAQKL
jgi:hypothetical protein